LQKASQESKGQEAEEYITKRNRGERIDKKSGETHPAPAASLSWP